MLVTLMIPGSYSLWSDLAKNFVKPRFPRSKWITPAHECVKHIMLKAPPPPPPAGVMVFNTNFYYTTEPAPVWGGGGDCESSVGGGDEMLA
jgi:hypothetical protein